MVRKIYILLIFSGIALALIAIPFFWFSYSASTDLQVDYLDVGQGDSILIKTPFGQNILIDGGPDDKVIKELNKNMSWWDRKIDLMILSHPHDDHVAGLTEVLKRYNVKRILYTGVIHTSPNYLKWLDKARGKKVPMTIVDRPQLINLGEELYINILYPIKSLLGKEVSNINSSSIVAKLVYKETSFLFSGDAEVEVEEKLLKPYLSPFFAKERGRAIENGAEDLLSSIDLGADVFKAGHHGSDTSNSQSFLEEIRPEIVVIQVGNANDFGHPSLRAIKRFERIGAEVLRNDILGTINLVSDGKNIVY